MNAMNRREFLGSGLAAGICSTGSGLISPFSRRTLDPKTTAVHAADSTPAWLTDEPVIMAGCWDDFPLFQKRRGGTEVWLKDLYRDQGSQQTVESLKEAGVTLVIIHFFKGFGLNAEREHIADARNLSRMLRQNGIRVGLYVGSTIAYETFLLEEPEAEAWFVPDFMGKPFYYPGQTFRRRVYFMHPGYRDYIKRVVRYGIENLKPDLIHFDNTSDQAEPPVFQHPLAIEDFRKYLVVKYTPAERKERLGFSDVRYIDAPKVESAPVRIDDPLFQEWAEFRCHQLSSYYAEMAAFIRSLNGSIAVENNPGAGISGRNLIWAQGVDYPRLVSEVDVAWTEEGDAATVTPEGILVSKIRTFKAVATLKRRVFCYTWGADSNWGYQENHGGLLQMAEAMAYNRQCLGMVGIVNAIADLPATPRQYIQFFHNNFHLYRDVESVADVALLYSFPSMGFNEDRPAASFMLAGQTLIQHRVLFDIIFDQHLADLTEYQVLFLADQECLSDHQIELIRDYVTNGGGLVATEHTSLYTERRVRRRDFGLRDCFGVSAPLWSGPGVPEAILPGKPVRTRVGKGEVVYIPEILASTASKPAHGDTRIERFFSLPVNDGMLSAALLSVMGKGGRLSTPGLKSPYVTTELVSQNHGQRLVLHLLNYDHLKTPTLEDIAIRLSIPDGKAVKQIQTLSPNQPGAAVQLRWNNDDAVNFIVPSLQVYSVVVIDLM